VELTEVPAGLTGRPSKAMSAQQAADVITKTASDRMHPYIVVSLLTGARTEELRALRWEHVHRVDRMSRRQFRPLSRCGARCARAATQRP
jgi:integrase